ncbi:hypothetical protein [Bacillus sp. NTK034]|uniref:hypothetical protein n=1 Tax=Bacillus sp. NTK034 TaxID=2802176 RepID=UPI001A8FD7D1|nr:hypothetical protein [Bacillus sp. NTK034]MBN8202141.1 hypothetical protein [Bacillus sp. NTK034]
MEVYLREDFFSNFNFENRFRCSRDDRLLYRSLSPVYRSDFMFIGHFPHDIGQIPWVIGHFFHISVTSLEINIILWA